MQRFRGRVIILFETLEYIVQVLKRCFPILGIVSIQSLKERIRNVFGRLLHSHSLTCNHIVDCTYSTTVSLNAQPLHGLIDWFVALAILSGNGLKFSLRVF